MKVELLDHMGSDLTVVNAARVSFDKESVLTYASPEFKELEIGSLSLADEKLIGYLARHNHWSPFAHTSIQLRLRAPIFVARQLVKHQVGLTWNEVSRRYVDAEPEFYMPSSWRSRPDGSIKQGSGAEHQDSKLISLETSQILLQVVNLYSKMIAEGVAPEQARMILPQSMFTEWWWTGSLMAFCRVCRERISPLAQAETRVIAKLIAEIVEPLYPVSWNALMVNY